MQTRWIPIGYINPLRTFLGAGWDVARGTYPTTDPTSNDIYAYNSNSGQPVLEFRADGDDHVLASRLHRYNATNNDIRGILVLKRGIDGDVAGANGVGGLLNFSAPNSAAEETQMGTLAFQLTDVTDAAENGKFSLNLTSVGALGQERLTVEHDGRTTVKLSGGSGVATYYGFYDSLIVDDGTGSAGGVSVYGADGTFNGYIIGSTSSSIGAYMAWRYSDLKFQLGTFAAGAWVEVTTDAGTLAAVFDSAQKLSLKGGDATYAALEFDHGSTGTVVKLASFLNDVAAERFQLTYDNTNTRLSIRDRSGNAMFSLKETSGQALICEPSVNNTGGNGLLDIRSNGDSGVEFLRYYYTHADATGPVTRSYRGRGTVGSPVDLVAGDHIWDERYYGRVNGAWIQFLQYQLAVVNVGASTYDARLHMYMVHDGLQYEKIRYSTDGGLLLNSRSTSHTCYFRLYQGGISGNDYCQIGWYSENQMQLLVNAVSGSSAILALDPDPADATSSAQVRLFRTTNTAGSKNLYIYRGNGSATFDHNIKPGTSGTLVDLCINGGVIHMGGKEVATVKDYADFYLSTGGQTGVGAGPVSCTINSTRVRSDASVFSLSASVVTVNKTADFKITGESYWNYGGTSRSEYSIWLEVDTGSGWTEVSGTRSGIYLRGYDSGSTGVFTAIVSVTSGDEFRIRVGRTDGSASGTYQDDNGTRLVFEEV